jgi:hypothetical protein
MAPACGRHSPSGMLSPLLQCQGRAGDHRAPRGLLTHSHISSPQFYSVEQLDRAFTSLPGNLCASLASMAPQ